MRISARSAVSALVGAAIVVAAALVTVPAVASHAAVSDPATSGASGTSLFLQVTGVTGEAAVGRQAGLIALTGYTDSYENASAGTGRGTGKPTFGGLTVTTPYSKAVPQLLARLATGAVLRTVKLEALKSVRGRTLNYLTITLTSARLVALSESGASTVPTVELRFVASKVCESYSPVTPTGTLGQAVSFCGNFKSAGATPAQP